MKNNNDSNSLFIKIILVIITVVFAASLGVVIFMSVQCYNCSSSINTTVDLSLLLSFLSLAFAIAIATPYFISKNQVKGVVRNYLENEYKKDYEKALEDMNRADAHLSRMMAFLLSHQQFYYWAIGWSFRSLKRYKNVKGHYVKTYQEFQQMLLRDVIIPSLNDIDNDRSDKIFNINDEKEKDLLVRRVKIRLVKDYVDFEYEIEKLYKNELFAKDIKGLCSGELKTIRPKMQNVIKELEKDCLEHKQKLFDEILPISSYHSADDSKGLIDFIKKSNLLSM